VSGTDDDKVFLPNGVSRNPPRRSTMPDEEAGIAIKDLVICVRGQLPNRELGHTDRFLAVGEWELALESVEFVLKRDEKPWHPWIQAAYDRADRAMPRKKNGRRL
jgi:hypothetical protein